MKLKGNNYWFFSMVLLSGIIAYPLMLKFGAVKGILLSFIPFFIGLITTHYKYKTDERDMQLAHRIDSYSSILLTIVMAIIYLYFPSLNWFFVFIASAGISRGISGLIVFSMN